MLKRLLFLTMIVCCISITLSAQSNYWTPATSQPADLPATAQREVVPDQFKTFAFHQAQLRSLLAKAPAEAHQQNQKGVNVMLPTPEGDMITFEVFETQNMEPALAARYPDIKSYAGYSGQWYTRFDLSPNGFHGVMRTSKGKVYISPFATQQNKYHNSYYLRDLAPETFGLDLPCGADQSVAQPMGGLETGQSSGKISYRGNAGDVVTFRTYRLAMSCTGEFGRRRGTVAKVLADMNTMVNLINEIFQQEMAAKLILVEDNDRVIYLDGATDPFVDANQGGSLINQNTNVLDVRIGTNNYDVGHILGVCNDVGGIASLGSVCSSGRKGAGVTCNAANNAVSGVPTFAHELGHQFAASHTFNNCNGNESSDTAFEPGSGSTIMSYGGLCGSNNVSSTRRDNYYHVSSLDQMYTFMETGPGNSCGVHEEIANTRPDIEMTTDGGFYIPMSTPFQLNAIVSDMEDDSIMINFEQFDNGGPIGRPLGQPSGDSPLFRSLPPGPDTFRVFPNLVDIINNNYPQREEVLPAYGRDLTFRATARDKNPLGNLASWDEINFRVSDQAGPFLVMEPNASGINWKANEQVEITWDVANTSIAPVNCQMVNIKLSLDGGYTYPVTLIENAFNDGSQLIYVPEMVTNQARIKIEAVNNIFFDISNANFSIEASSAPTYTVDIAPDFQFSCPPEGNTVVINTESKFGYDSLLTVVVGDLPDGATITQDKSQITPGESVTLDFDMSEVTVGIGSYDVDVLLITPGGDTTLNLIQLLVEPSFFESLAVETPYGETGLDKSVEFTWHGTPDARTYTFELATSPTFGNTVIESVQSMVDTHYVSEILLDFNKEYFWRVIPKNNCGTGAPSTPGSFYTTSFDCNIYESNDGPVNISASGTPTIASVIPIDAAGTVASVSIPEISGNHNSIRHIQLSLLNPEDKEIKLMSNLRCNTQNFSVTFDDSSIEEVDCPPLRGKNYRPQEPLSGLIGEQLKGQWKMQVKVTDELGDGGALDFWKLEVCAALDPSNPFMINNDTLDLPPGEVDIITSGELEAQDDDNTANELSYTLVTAPLHGTVKLNGNDLAVGDNFTQQDINDNRLRYRHDNSDTQFDHFYFTIKDGSGGWFGQPRFNIKIDENATVGTEELSKKVGMQVYPNPTRDALFVRFNNAQPSVQWSLLNTQGQLIRSGQFSAGQPEHVIATSDLHSGMYLLRIENQYGVGAKTFVVQR